MAEKGQHVMPQFGKWGVRKAGSARSTSVHETQAEAIEAAMIIARNQKTDLFIHGRDGRIYERRSFGADPVPAKV